MAAFREIDRLLKTINDNDVTFNETQDHRLELKDFGIIVNTSVYNESCGYGRGTQRGLRCRLIIFILDEGKLQMIMISSQRLLPRVILGFFAYHLFCYNLQNQDKLICHV